MKVRNDLLVIFIRHWIPGFEVRYKNESWVQKLIGILVWIFNRRYMTDFTTVVGTKVYFPSREFIERRNGSLEGIFLHEFVHMWDLISMGKLKFYFTYFSPQIFGFILLLLSPLCLFIPHPSWVVFLFVIAAFGIILVLPWPSSGRTNLELRGYTMNVYLSWRKHNFVGEVTKDTIVKQFTSWNYYKMWPDDKKIREEIENFVALLRDNHGELEKFSDNYEWKPYILVKQFLDDLGE